MPQRTFVCAEDIEIGTILAFDRFLAARMALYASLVAEVAWHAIALALFLIQLLQEANNLI